MKHKKDCDYLKNELFSVNCPECNEIWCKFLDKNKNIFVVTDKYDE